MLTEQHLRSILHLNTLMIKVIRRKIDLKCKRSTLTTIMKEKQTRRRRQSSKTRYQKHNNEMHKESKNMLEKVAAIIREQLNQENVEITEATRFKEDLEVDSLDLFELVMAFEEEYGVSIPSEELENMATVGDVIRYIQEHA